MVVLTYTILMVGLLCIAFGLFQFVKTEQQVSHFHSIAITEGSTAGTLNTAALLQGQYKTVGKGFIVGQRITIQDGPLRNVEGVLTEIKSLRNLIVSITLLQRSVAVCVERAGVRPVAA